MMSGERHRKANAFRDLGTPGDPRLLSAIERRTPGVAGGGINHFFGGTVITPPKKSKKSAKPACAFGQIITIPDTDPPEKGIRGGLVHCGDQNWNFDPQSLNLEADGAWLVYLDVDLEVNRDDDGEILMPGVKTGTKPTGDWSKTTWTEGANYPDNTAPVASTGNGTIILPLGKLTIADGVATFEPTGCGNFTIGHCAGTLSYSRA